MSYSHLFVDQNTATIGHFCELHVQLILSNHPYGFVEGFMSFRFRCPSCDELYQLKDTLAGRTVRCRVCNERITFPRADGTRPDAEDVEEDDHEPIAPPLRRRAKAVVSVGKKRKAGRGKQKRNQPMLWAMGVAGGLVLMMFLVCGGAFMYGVVKGYREARRTVRERDQVAGLALLGDIPEEGPATVPYPIERYPLPSFPELGVGQLIADSNVRVQSITLQSPSEKSLLPSFAMQMRVYIPDGQHSARSLPLVLVPPAGTPLFVGNGLDTPDYHAETLPYAKAGAVAILFSLDGGLVDFKQATGSELSVAYTKFRAAGAGTVNARTALQFALTQIPAVDPNRIVIAGHSSAGTLSMLFAAHEPRLAAAIAYCPCTDVELRLQELLAALKGKSGFPELPTFVEKSSPKRHAARVHCPTFLFHATDDSNVSYMETFEFFNLLRSFGKDSVLSEPPVLGGHYKPMITDGIPRAIRWLQERNILRSNSVE